MANTISTTGHLANGGGLSFNRDYGTAICPHCGGEFSKTHRHHKVCGKRECGLKKARIIKKRSEAKIKAAIARRNKQ